MEAFDLKSHLRKEHKRTAVSEYFREIVYGGNDGIVTTFAVVAGFTGAAASSSVPAIPFMSVLLFGMANLFADALSMSLGSFLSLRADRDIYQSERLKEREEIRKEPEKELAETIHILELKGFSTEDSTKIANLYRKNEPYWTEFMMHDELDMSNPFSEHPLYVALSTFFSFVIFGCIPLLPYLVFGTHPNIFIFSVGSTVTALIVLGSLRAYITKNGIFRAVGETLLIGGLSAFVAFFVGTFFRG